MVTMVPSSWIFAENPNFCDFLMFVESWKKPQVVGQDITALPPELRHLELEIYSQPCFVGRAEQVTPNTTSVFFFKIGQVKTHGNTSRNGKPIFDLKVGIFCFCQIFQGSTSWHEMVHRRFPWNLPLKFLQGKLLQEVDARRGPTSTPKATYMWDDLGWVPHEAILATESTDASQLLGSDCRYSPIGFYFLF